MQALVVLTLGEGRGYYLRIPENKTNYEHLRILVKAESFSGLKRETLNYLRFCRVQHYHSFPKDRDVARNFSHHEFWDAEEFLEETHMSSNNIPGFTLAFKVLPEVLSDVQVGRE